MPDETPEAETPEVVPPDVSVTEVTDDTPEAEAPVSRDERHDSIDPATGTLTAEAQELRRQMESEG